MPTNRPDTTADPFLVHLSKAVPAAALADADDELRDVLRGVAEHDKAGTLTLQIKVEPAKAGAVYVVMKTTAKVPKAKPESDIAYIVDGRLQKRDPRQPQLTEKVEPTTTDGRVTRLAAKDA